MERCGHIWAAVNLSSANQGFALTDSHQNGEEKHSADSLRPLHMCNPSVFLFLSGFLTAPPTLLPKQMQASHLCTPPAVNTHTQANRLTCGNTFTLPCRLRLPCERLHQQQGPLAVATVQTIPAGFADRLRLRQPRSAPASCLPQVLTEDRRRRQRKSNSSLQRQSKKQLESRLPPIVNLIVIC